MRSRAMAEAAISQQPFDSVPLSDRQVRELLKNREREHAAFGLRGPATGAFSSGTRLSMELIAEGGGNTRHSAVGLTLTETGVAVMLGRYVHAGTEVLVTLPTLEGEPVLLPGVVKSAQLMGGRVHEVLVGFDEPVDPCNYVRCVRIEREEIAAPDDLISAELAELDLGGRGAEAGPAQERPVGPEGFDERAVAVAAIALAQRALDGAERGELVELAGALRAMLGEAGG